MQHKKSTTITRFLSIILLLALSFTANNVFAGEAEGKVLYQSKCQRCHLVDKKLTGPALQNVRTRWADSTNLYAWIKNSQSFLGTGDKYANDLYKEYNSIMPAFPELSDVDVADILVYIDAEAKRKQDMAATPGPGGVVTETKKDNSTLYWILIVALLFIAVILGRAVK